MAKQDQPQKITFVMFYITNVIRLQRSIRGVKLLSDRLRDTRLQRGLSQKKLARASGVSQSAIAHYEGNTRRSPKKIFELAQALKVNARWLATGEGSADDTTNYPGSLDASRMFSGESGPGTTFIKSDPAAPWPFHRLSADRLNTLTSEELELIEQTVISLVTSFENRRQKQHKEREDTNQ